MADWVKIKNEYITTNVSQRTLAVKYGVNQASISAHCKKEEWLELRKKNLIKKQSELNQKTIEKIAEKEAQNIVDSIQLLGNLLIDIEALRGKINSAIDMLDISKPERTLIKITETGRNVVSEESGIYKADKLSNILSKLTKSVVDAVDGQMRFSDDKENYDDDGLLEALNASFEDLEDDSAMLPDEDE